MMITKLKSIPLAPILNMYVRHEVFFFSFHFFYFIKLYFWQRGCGSVILNDL